MKPSRLSLLCSLLASSAGLFASGLDEHLVARWTFNDRTFPDQNLRSDVGRHEFRHIKHGERPDYSFDEGTVTLGPGCLLVCESLSVKNHPQLTSAVTVWARVRVEKPAAADSFSFGFRNTVPPGDWDDMVLATLHRPQPSGASSFLARLLGQSTPLTSGSRHQVLEAGRWTSVALVFDGARREVGYVLDGTAIRGRHGEATTLATFTNFALGRLKESGGSASLTFDEVRVYSTALSPEWIGEIEAVKEVR